MAYANINGISLYYRVDDSKPDTPWLVLSNSLGSDVGMWAPQVSAFAEHFRVLRYDTRGHGRSAAPRGPYTIEELTSDVISLMDHLGITRANFLGLSMGGLTGVALGARHADRFERIVLSNTAAKIGSPEVWLPRAAKAREDGLAGMAGAVLARWLTPAVAAQTPFAYATLRDTLLHTDREGYAANCEAINATDLRDDARLIKVPVLVIAGMHDMSTPPAQGRELADSIVGARFVEFADASHLANIEVPGRYTRTVLDFLLDKQIL
ncbi:3-oxoadipate enol-lactonase [Burkholderia cenocepacia]|uniref:3-oxoadipate enol-lactonase n=1 Tax=Burkholderia cenocepacia TaxID=95486 RepID=UPI00286417C6|nr:3-oxoadipate enol-lactonase [Burkholderia cenocepacia]MDR5645478.1 3-oxoadipate enol-lactonase [Burkholderia cenocepacia]